MGTYTVYVKAVNANYEDAPTSGTLTIKRRQVVITGNNDTLPYNGDTQTVEGYTAAQAAPGSDTGLLGGHTVEGATAAASAKNVGTRIPGTITDAGAVTITADGADVTKNYDIVTRPGWITITPLTIKVESKGGEQRYSGQPLRVAEAEITDGALAGSDTITYNFTGGQTNIGSSANTFTAIIRSGEESANDNYTIQYEYGTLTVYGEISYAANGGTGEAPDPDRYDSGDRYEVKENSFFTREGYTFTGWNTRANGQGTPYAPGNAITNLATGNLTLYAQWTANTDTRYTVETYLEGEDGTYPSAASTSEEREGTTDTTVSVSEADKTAPEGYALDPEADNVFEGIVKGDGSLVLKIYFARDAKGGGDDGDEPDDIPDRYQLVFRYVANANGSVSGTVTEVHTFGNETDGYTRPTATTPDAAVAAAADPGYHILGWTDEASEDLGDGEAPDFGGLTYRVDQTFTVSFEEDGNITIQYKADGHGTVSRDSESLAPATGTAQGSVAAAETGYHFDGWYLGENKVGDQEEFVPSKNGEGVYETATYVAKFAPDEDTAYKIDFYYTDDNGDYPDIPARTDERSGTTDTQASVTDADKQPEYEGYILDTSADNVFEGNIAGDGSLVLKVYFAIDNKGGGEDGEEPDDIPDYAQIIFRYVIKAGKAAEANGTLTGQLTEVHTFGDAESGYTKPAPTTPDAAVTAKANAGYHIAGWVDEASEDLGAEAAPVFGERQYDTDQTFAVSFAENDDITIKYEAKEHGSVSRDEETLAPATGEAKGSVAKPDKGYHLVGWYLDDELVSEDLNFLPSRNDSGVYEEATYVAKFAPEEQTLYTVEFYYADDDGTYPGKPERTAQRNGVTDTEVSVTDADKTPAAGYMLDESADNVFSGTIKGDGSLVLKLYFTKDAIGGGDDGNEPDGIPDFAQIIFRYVAKEHGSVSGTTVEVRTFRDAAGNYTRPTAVTPYAAVEAEPDAGYVVDVWSDEDGNEFGSQTAPAISSTYDRSMTFYVTFKTADGKKVSGTNTTGTTRTRRTPKTGDETALGLWLALAATAAAGSCGILYKRRKKKS